MLGEQPSTRMVKGGGDGGGPRYERLGRVRLKVVAGPEAGRDFHVAVARDRVLRGGRSDLNEVVLRDELISAFHFSLQFEAEGIVLRDLGSRNGTFAGGVRVREAVLDLDAVFCAGETTLQVAGADKVSVPLSTSDHFGDMYGTSPIMRELFAELDRVAALPSSTLPVLVTGETGTGKELVARGLHERSARAKQPFVVLDCTALPRELADAIVFGHGRGAFTGAVADHAGVFEQDHRGTLFIDELGELPLELQPKLLRVLDRGEVCRFNEPRSVRAVDVRVVCATHRDLRRMVAEKRFREDLYFRILGKHVQLPSLRERDDDVVLLAERFLAAIAGQLNEPRRFTPAAYAALRAARWPGNVRQLRKVVECAAQLCTGGLVDAGDLGLEAGDDATGGGDVSPLLLMPWAAACDEFQREYLKALMQRVGARRGWINRAAEFAGMGRDGFVKALKRLELYPHAVEAP
jgi:DNA-binding NtrC family response regulator